MKEGLFRLLNPFHKILIANAEFIMGLRYYKAFGKRMNLKNPQYYHERIFYNAFKTDTSLWTKCADKYAVRQYVEEHYGKNILTKLYGVWEDPEQIDFNELPNSFVLKTTNGCGTNIIVRDKTKINPKQTRATLHRWMKLHFGAFTAEPHYYHIPVKIIAEELLFDERHPNEPLRDYKFMCFNGVPQYLQVYTNRIEGTHKMNRTILDMDWNDLGKELYSIKQQPLYSKIKLDRPENFEQMKEIVKALAKGLPYVRVDLYEINGKPIFGEMTFTPGIDVVFTDEMQLKLGEMIPLADSTQSM